MDAFVRQLAVLSVLWSLSELLLPEGRLKKMARMTVSVLVMAALVSGLGSWRARCPPPRMRSPGERAIRARR